MVKLYPKSAIQYFKIIFWYFRLLLAYGRFKTAFASCALTLRDLSQPICLLIIVFGFKIHFSVQGTELNSLGSVVNYFSKFGLDESVLGILIIALGASLLIFSSLLGIFINGFMIRLIDESVHLITIDYLKRLRLKNDPISGAGSKVSRILGRAPKTLSLVFFHSLRGLSALISAALVILLILFNHFAVGGVILCILGPLLLFVTPSVKRLSKAPSKLQGHKRRLSNSFSIKTLSLANDFWASVEEVANDSNYRDAVHGLHHKRAAAQRLSALVKLVNSIGIALGVLLVVIMVENFGADVTEALYLVILVRALSQSTGKAVSFLGGLAKYYTQSRNLKKFLLS